MRDAFLILAANVVVIAAGLLVGSRDPETRKTMPEVWDKFWEVFRVLCGAWLLGALVLAGVGLVIVGIVWLTRLIL